MAGAISPLHWLDLAAPPPMAELDPQYEVNLAIARADGFDAGYAAARAEVDATQAAVAGAIEIALSDSEAKIDQLVAELSAEAANLALAIGEHLAGIASKGTDAALARTVSDAVRQAVGNPVLRLTVASETAATVNKLANAAVDRIGACVRIDVEGDTSMRPGDIRADWQTGGLLSSAAERRAAVLADIAAAGL